MQKKRTFAETTHKNSITMVKRYTLLLGVVLCGVSGLWAQDTEISLEDVVSGRYRARSYYGASPLPDGASYATIDGSRLLRHSYATGEVTDTLLDTRCTQGHQVDNFSAYQFSPDQRYVLLTTNRQDIYRRSYTAEHYVYDTQSNTLTPLSEAGAQECPLFAPNSRLVGFVRQGNLFVKDLQEGTERAITSDGLFNHIINGKPDWVYEEEFEYNRAFDFSADSRHIAWMRTDESRVRTFHFPWYQGTNPQLTDYALYPGSYEYKYPKAGELNSIVSIHSHDLSTGKTITVEVPLDSDGYIPRLQFTTDPNKLAILTLNRLQNRCDLYFADPASGQCTLALRETNDRYINVSYYHSLALALASAKAKGLNQFTLLSERDGWQHLYLYDLNGQLVQQLTSGAFNVTAYYGSDARQKNFYYASNEGSPLEQYIYKVDSKGRKTLLTEQKGFHTALFSADMSHFVHVFSNLLTPPVTSLCDNRGQTLHVVEDNAALSETYAHLRISPPELFSFTTSEGVTLNGWMVKPADFCADSLYPVLMYQYSGPGDQQVHNSWNNGNALGLIWEHRLAQKGYIVVCVDGRGTGGRGEEFQKCTYLTMGDLESKDQVETALHLAALPYVDASRIAIWGWSFGGFNTIMSMTEGRPAFCCGVAVAPVTDWRFYDTAYTERYMRTPQENPTGYDTSPLHRFTQLHGDLLLVHGLADDNVHFQNTAELAEQLTQAGIPFEMHTYTNRNHSIYGGNTRLHLFQRIERFLDQHLLP